MSHLDSFTYVPAGIGYYIIENVDGELIKGEAVLAWRIESINNKGEDGGESVTEHIQPVTLNGYSNSQFVGIIEPSGRINSFSYGECDSLEEMQINYQARKANN